MDMGLYNKYSEPRGSHGTLIGNWAEERALKQATGFQRYQPYKDDKISMPQTNLRILQHSDNCDTPGQKVSVFQSSFRAPGKYDEHFFHLNSRKKEKQLINNLPLPETMTPSTQTYHLFRGVLADQHNPHSATMYNSSHLERMNTNPYPRMNSVPPRAERAPYYSSNPYHAALNPANGPHNASAYEVKPNYSEEEKQPAYYQTRRIPARPYQM